MSADVVHFDDYRLDMPNAQLWRGEELVKLAPKALSLLDYLVTRPGQLVTKDELFEAVWPEVVVSEGAMAECIREVRRALVQLQGTSLGIAIPSPLWGEGEGEGNRMRFQPPSPPSSPASGRGGKTDSQRGRLFLH